jgi:hypothetical protein
MNYDLGCFDKVTVNGNVSAELCFVYSVIITLQVFCYTGFGFLFKCYNSRPYSFLQQYLWELLKAMKDDGCNVIGYTMWSLMDNFEWCFGYT